MSPRVVYYFSFIFITKSLRGHWKPVHVKAKENHPQPRVISGVQRSGGFGYQRSCVGKQQRTQATKVLTTHPRNGFSLPPAPWPPSMCISKYFAGSHQCGIGMHKQTSLKQLVIW